MTNFEKELQKRLIEILDNKCQKRLTMFTDFKIPKMCDEKYRIYCYPNNAIVPLRVV